MHIPDNNLTQLPGKFPPEIERNAKLLNLKDEVFLDRSEVQGFTLDDADSPDLDDAIWLEETAEGWKIQVTISDVDTLVEKDSYLDFEALSRTTSHYFPARHTNGKYQPKVIIPMIPKVLSENRLSLLEGKLRPTLTVEITLDKDLQIGNVEIKKTFLRSSHRLGLREYGNNKIIGDPELPLRNYYRMAKNLNRKRWAEHSIAFQELREGISTDEDGMVHEGSISASALIVQEFMILANSAVAEFLQENRQVIPFRNHQPAKTFVPSRELIIREIEKHSDYLLLVDNIRAIYSKYLSKAIYQDHPEEHYGLGLPVYTHFTSPIRRYADLVVHRVAKALIEEKPSPYSQEEMAELCQYLNLRQRRLATLRANLEGTNSFSNYQHYGYLLDTKKAPDYTSRLLEFLQINRIGNPYFEFTASDGVNIELSCMASIRFQRARHVVEFTARADKNTVKNQAARMLLKKIKELVANSQNETLGRNASEKKSPSENGHGPIWELYNYCEKESYPRPTFHYEFWNGGAWPISCICQISESLMVVARGDTRHLSKSEAAQKLLDYLKSGQPISRQSLYPKR